ncbi:MAG: nucleotidyltransferase domain-containing protein [Sulfurimonas sp.]|uniref:type VII toxin-antitoxin system MntA family adenylyltransferase antitoxin n=1 Tax=Sulfurimonas sp. TaxID=2022749 RepID=UPI00262DFC33|nr:nucleotidyltransferase domain-containing protein [Sulfurimonas sp.]MDD5401291.1 nucleotidyltransferase domain-containing protein [Sulfurimonas sp.]
MTQSIIKNLLIQKLQTLANVEFAYLFGSYAEDLQKESSDIDIAVFLNKTDLDSQLQLNYELSKFLKRDVDLLLLNSAKNLFLLEAVLKKGVILKDCDERVDFELRTGHDILDYKEFKRSIDAA